MKTFASSWSIVVGRGSMLTGGTYGDGWDLFVTEATQYCDHGRLQTREARPTLYKRIDVTTLRENEASLHCLQWLCCVPVPFSDPKRTGLIA